MLKHQVIIKDKVVWEDNFKVGSTKNFPDEYRGRPESGSVTLKIGEDIVGVQIPLADEEAAMEAAAKAAAEGGE